MTRDAYGPPNPLARPARRRPVAKARPRRSFLRQFGRALAWIGLSFVAISVGLVVVYRFVPPPITLTMIGGAIQGHGLTKDWMSLSAMDPNMPRAAIAGEDAEFCSHHGFDYAAIANAFRRNARGGRVRGGSTISQQTAKNVFLIQGGSYPARHWRLISRS